MRVTSVVRCSHLWKKYLLTCTEARDTRVNDKPRYVTFSHPGLPYWAFDIHPAIPDLLNVIRVCEDCFLYGGEQTLPEQHNQTLDLCSEMMQSGFMYFQTSIEMKMTKALYSEAVPKWPLKALYGHGYRTGSFITNHLVIKSFKQEHPLFTMTIGAGYVDSKTRKLAESLPLWFTSSLDGKEILQEGLKIKRLKKRPSETYKQKMMVLFSDLDVNGHANFKTYISKSYESLRQAVTMKEFSSPTAGTLSMKNSEGESVTGSSQVLPRWLTSTIMRQGVKTMRVRFIKESMAGEEVSIHLWQEEDKPLWVFFSMERDHDQSLKTQVLFEMALEYFGPSSNL